MAAAGTPGRTWCSVSWRIWRRCSTRLGAGRTFGASSGGALALEAAAAGLPIAASWSTTCRTALPRSGRKRWRAYRAELDEALAQGRIDEALAAFMRLGGASDDDLAGARAAPFWDGLLALAPTLAYDAAVIGDDGPPSGRLANIRQETMVLTRSTSVPSRALPVEFFAAEAHAVATALPHV